MDHGIFNMHKHLRVCCTHCSETGTAEPVLAEGQTHTYCFHWILEQCLYHQVTINCSKVSHLNTLESSAALLALRSWWALQQTEIITTMTQIFEVLVGPTIERSLQQ